MQRISIMGFGLMGGSLGLALKQRQWQGRIVGYARREETRRAALEQGLVDEVFDHPLDAARDADLIVVCLPILSIPSLVSSFAPGLKQGCVVTDVGSTKTALEEDVTALLEGSNAVFVGSHPVAGSEQQGLDAARPDLYEGALTIVTAPPDVNAEAVERVRELWETVGSHVTRMSALEHDRIMARTSHLPHFAAVLLAGTVGRDEELERMAAFCGTGFRDTSRVAEGSPAVWHDIALSNRQSIIDEMKAFREELSHFMDLMERCDFDALRAYLADVRERRMTLVSKLEPRESRD